MLVIGNSITHHSPSQALGWRGNWGMAASAADSDYVAQLLKQLREKTIAERWMVHRYDGHVLETVPADFHLPGEIVRLAQAADIVIIALGDNVELRRAHVALFATTYERVANAIRPANGRLLCVGTWWDSQVKNDLIRERCRAAQGIYVDISGLSALAENRAGDNLGFLHPGVASHPGDKGMKAIAGRIMNALNQ